MAAAASRPLFSTTLDSKSCNRAASGIVVWLRRSSRCGLGRDALAFHVLGYRVSAFDVSESLGAHAAHVLGSGLL
jgi:hypothetical protein